MSASAAPDPTTLRPRRSAHRALALALGLGAALVGCAVVEGDGDEQARGAADAGPSAPGAADARVADATPDAALPLDPVEIELIPALAFDDSGRAAFEFDVPPDLRAVTLSADGPPATLMVFERIEDGEGRAWVSPDPGPMDAADRMALAFPGPFMSPNRVVWGDSVATALVPNNPAVRPAPGRWRAVLAADPPPEGTADVYAQIERGPAPAEGRLDLHFHFTEAAGWRAADAAMDAEFRRMLNTVVVLLRDVGVEVGRVTYTDVPVTTFSVSVQVELPRLLRLSERSSGLSVFVVGRIEDALGGPLAGIAGAVPSSSGLPGTGANGVAIARALADGRALGATLAHEIGHALGLFHTVEANPDYVDQLDDTAEGEPSRGNVMYPTAGQDARRFSRQQGEVLRRSRSVDGPG